MRSIADLALWIQQFSPDNFTQFIKRISLILLMVVGWNVGRGQVLISTLDSAYTQNFDGMGNSGTGQPFSTGFVTGSVATTNAGGVWSAGNTSTNYAAGTAGIGVVTGTSSVGSYNFGFGQTDTAKDRALGFISSSLFVTPRSIVYAFKNQTGVVVKKIDITCNYEKYRSGASAYSMIAYHGPLQQFSRTTTTTITNGATSTIAFSGTNTTILPGMQVTSAAFPSGTFVVSTALLSGNTSVKLSTTATASLSSLSSVDFSVSGAIPIDTTIFPADPNSATVINNKDSVKRKLFSLTNLNINDGDTYFIRWMYNGSTNGPQALALDDVSISLGDGNCPPYKQARIDSFVNVDTTKMTLKYKRTSGAGLLIVASTDSNWTTGPTNGVTYINPNSNYRLGDSLALGTYVVYNGISKGIYDTSSVTVSNLLSSSNYYYYLFEYNNSGSSICYKTPGAKYVQSTKTASSDFFSSRTSGKWQDPTTWESSRDSIKWIISTLKPSSEAKNILVKDSVIIDTTSTETARLLTISSSGILTSFFNNATGSFYRGGDSLIIYNNSNEEFDFKIYGKYIIFGNCATLKDSVKVKIYNGGIVKVDANNRSNSTVSTSAKSDDFARFSNVCFSSGSVLDWNTTTAPQSSSQTYFNYSLSSGLTQPKSEVPTFRVSKNITLGSGTPTIINGIIEVNSTVNFSAGGQKIFRNGIIGIGSLNQTTTCGLFSISDSASLGGTVGISLNNNGLKIESSSKTTLKSSKTIQGGPLYIDGTLDLSNYDLTLASTATATASLGKMGTSGTINYSGTGRFVVERYVSTGTSGSQHGKSWQFLATPTWGDNQTINSAWQEGATTADQNLLPGYGTQITGLGGWTFGFDRATSTPSMKTYDASNDSWVGVPNTISTSIYNPKGYMVFVRGDRSVINFNSAGCSNCTPVPTILRTRGRLFDNINPPVSTMVAPGKLESIGNPYPSAIDFYTILSQVTSGSLNSVFYVWDPTLPSSNGLGGWQTFSGAASLNYYPIVSTSFYPSSIQNTTIQSGQAFIVSSTSGATVKFSEDAKLSSNRLVNRAPVSFNQLSILSSYLRTTLNNEMKTVDGNRIVFDNSYSYNIDENDATKIINPGENWGIKKHHTLIAVEARGLLNVNDTIFYNVSNLYQPNYQLLIAPQNIVSRGLVGLLVDKYLNTKTPISLTDSNFINFSVNSDVASKASDRFMLVFQRVNTPLPVRFLSINATRNKQNNPVVNWSVDNEININRYELEVSRDGLSFEKINTQSPSITVSNTKNYSYSDNIVLLEHVFYRVKAISIDGQAQYSKIVQLSSINKEASINIYPNPTTSDNIQIKFSNTKTGYYLSEINNMAGQVVYREKWLNLEDNFLKKLKIPTPLTKGIYKLRVIHESGEYKILRLIIN